MRLAMVLGIVALGGAALARASDAALPDAALGRELATLAAGGRVAIAGEEIVSHVALPRLYAALGGGRLWQDPARFATLKQVVAESAGDGLTPADYHARALERLGSAADAGADLLATDAFVMLQYDLYLGKVDPVTIEADWNVPRRRLREGPALEFLTQALRNGEIRESVARVRPNHWLYEHGRAALARYRGIEAAGGWGTVAKGPKLEPGGVDARVPSLRRRLAASGDYAGAPSDSTLYDAALVEALKVFQRRHLLSDDGEVGPTTLRELDVPVSARIDQIRLNLERGRWVLHEIGDGDLVVVDIAGYGVRFLRDHHTIWRARAIVGQRYRQTPVFGAQIENIVFNPTWTVPPGILARDVLPQMQRGENALAHKKLKVFTRDGAPVDPATIRWADYTVQDFPYVLRQDAGDENALGHVKINFPNPYLVYLHDTPSRSLFDKSQRNFSSGCIRIDRPLELVELLLADPVRWNAAAIKAAVDAGTTRTVELTRKVPVLLIYWTADEDPDGRLVFKRDSYGRDARLLRALDARFRFGTRPRL